MPQSILKEVLYCMTSDQLGVSANPACILNILYFLGLTIKKACNSTVAVCVWSSRACCRRPFKDMNPEYDGNCVVCTQPEYETRENKDKIRTDRGPNGTPAALHDRRARHQEPRQHVTVYVKTMDLVKRVSLIKDKRESITYKAGSMRKSVWRVHTFLNTGVSASSLCSVHMSYTNQTHRRNDKNSTRTFDGVPSVPSFICGCSAKPMDRSTETPSSQDPMTNVLMASVDGSSRYSNTFLPTR